MTEFEKPKDLEDRLSLQKRVGLKPALDKITAFFANAAPNLTNYFFAKSKGDMGRIMIRERKPGSFQCFNSFYDYDPKNPADIYDKIMQDSPVVDASRNRFKLLKHYLTNIIDNTEDPNLMLSVAGGNARFELEAMNEASKDSYLVCVDFDSEAEEEGIRIANQYGLEDNVIFVNDTLVFDENLSMNKYLNLANKKWNIDKKSFDTIIQVGLNEWLDVGSNENKELGNLYDCFSREQQEGHLVTEQTGFNDNIPYLEATGWDCRYRTKEELTDEVKKAGYNIKLSELEPVGITSIIIGEK